MAEGVIEAMREAGTFVLIGLPSAIARTLLKPGRTWRDFVANCGSALVVAPLAGHAAQGLGWNTGLVFVSVGVATLFGSDLLLGLLRLGEEFKSDPKGAVRGWVDWWRGRAAPPAP